MGYALHGRMRWSDRFGHDGAAVSKLHPGRPQGSALRVGQQKKKPPAGCTGTVIYTVGNASGADQTAMATVGRTGGGAKTLSIGGGT